MKKSLPQVDEVAKKSRKSRKFAKMVKLNGLNEVGDKNLIFQNDRLATATQKIKKNSEKSTNRICKQAALRPPRYQTLTDRFVEVTSHFPLVGICVYLYF